MQVSGEAVLLTPGGQRSPKTASINAPVGERHVTH